MIYEFVGEFIAAFFEEVTDSWRDRRRHKRGKRK